MYRRIFTRALLAKYRVYLQEQEKSPATVEKYIRDVNKFYQFLSGSKWIHKKAVLEYKQDLIENYKAVSVNSMLAGLNSFLDFAGLSRLRVRQLKIQRRMFLPEEKELSGEEYRRLLQTARRDERLYLIMQTLCGTGMRVSELKYITVEAIRVGRCEVRCKNKSRTVWIPDKLLDMLQKYIRKQEIRTGVIFLTRNRKPVDRCNIWKQMKALCKESGVLPEKVFPHNLRHLFAQTYYRREKDIVKLGDILGHCNIETTRIYTLTSGKEHARQINALNLII